MFSRPPFLNLTVIRSSDLDRAEAFYNVLGIFFERHRHGKGPVHLSAAASEADPVFEIYPLGKSHSATTSVRIGFSIDCVDPYLDKLVEKGGEVVSGPKDSEWGRRAVVKDPDGHTVELVTPGDRDK